MVDVAIVVLINSKGLMSNCWNLFQCVATDILVGAYESDKAVLLRSRPIVRVETELRFEPNIFHLDKRSCTLLDGTPVTW